MQVYQERRKIHRFLRSRPVLFFLAALALILLVASARMTIRAFQAAKTREALETEYQRVLEQKSALDKRIGDLENQEAIEKEAKKRFNILSPGEKVLIIVEPSGAPEASDEAAYQRAWEFIKKLFR